jgi:rhodanese-related sulfurtransferase
MPVRVWRGHGRHVKGPKLLIWGLVAVVLLALGIALTRPAGGTRQDIGDAKLLQLQAQGARIVDVREPGEFSLGHIAGAVNVPMTQLQSAAESWSKDQPVVVYCATGARSLNAASYLVGVGFAKVYNLTAGIAAWTGPLTKDASASAAPPPALKTNGKPIFIDFYSDT